MWYSYSPGSRGSSIPVSVHALMLGLLSAYASGILNLPASAQSQPSEPVAIVEDVDGAEVGVDVFEFLEAGRLIRLSADQMLVLGYLTSCLRETIHGGDVTIGTVLSSVAGGLVIREEVECDGGSTELTVAEASQSGVITFRQGPISANHGTRFEPIKLFSTEPVFIFSESAAELILHRLDLAEADLRVPVRQTSLDLADESLSLGPGGLYEARVGTKKLVFEITSHAGPGGPVVGRVIRF